MKRVSWLFLLAALAAATTPASAAKIGVGAYGGLSVPIVQDDNGSGSQFGIRVPVSLVPMITVEPYFAKTSGGDKDQEALGITYTRSGIDVTSFGANVLLSMGGPLQFYPYAGIGKNKMERDGMDANEIGYTFGLGFGFRVPGAPFAIHARGGVNAVLEPDNSDTSRKWGDATIGVTYDLFSFAK